MYEAERRGIQPKAGDIFGFYYSIDYTGKLGNGRNGEKGNRDNNRLNSNRSRGENKVNPITQFNVNEDKDTVTYTNANGETITESLRCVFLINEKGIARQLSLSSFYSVFMKAE